MDKRFEDALDECLSHLSKGEDLETCLRRFPRSRKKLEPLLRIAIALRRRAAAATFPAAALARSRARVMAAVQARQVPPPSPSPPPWLAQLPRAPSARAVVTTTLAFILLGALLTSSSIASVNSLPGNPLYAIKRASERIRLLLTHDDQVRQKLAQHYAALRMEEIRQVTGQGRIATVDFTGQVDSIQGETITVEGISVHIGTHQNLSGLQVGDRVQVVGHTRDDGSVELQSLAVSAPTMTPPCPPTLQVQ